MKIIISGGGTGGHIFPAISIANALKSENPETEILFVGASGKMEMQRVPQAGYTIIGLPIRGFQRGRYMQNISALFLLFISIFKALFVLLKHKPKAVIGVGGYASGAIGFVASLLRIPVILQEQNSYAGITNKLLSKKASKICVAYKGMERFFPKDKIALTGNPVRKNLFETRNKQQVYQSFGFDNSKKTLLIVGGSLGAKSINVAMKKNLEHFANSDIQVLWQAGKLYYSNLISELGELPKNIKILEFIDDMNAVYTIADLVITRAGAGTISELCLLGKSCIFVPSPNVSEDHQTKNAMALVTENAGEIIKDSDIQIQIATRALELIKDESKLTEYATNIKKLAFKDSDKKIVKEIYNSLKQ